MVYYAQFWRGHPGRAEIFAAIAGAGLCPSGVRGAAFWAIAAASEHPSAGVRLEGQFGPKARQSQGPTAPDIYNFYHQNREA